MWHYWVPNNKYPNLVGGGGGGTHQSFIQSGSTPRTNPLPFYIHVPFFTEKVYLLLTNGTPFTHLQSTQ